MPQFATNPQNKSICGVCSKLSSREYKTRFHSLRQPPPHPFIVVTRNKRRLRIALAILHLCDYSLNKYKRQVTIDFLFLSPLRVGIFDTLSLSLSLVIMKQKLLLVYGRHNCSIPCFILYSSFDIRTVTDFATFAWIEQKTHIIQNTDIQDSDSKKWKIENNINFRLMKMFNG